MKTLKTCDTCARQLPKRAKHKRQCATCIKRAQGKLTRTWRWPAWLRRKRGVA